MLMISIQPNDIVYTLRSESRLKKLMRSIFQQTVYRLSIAMWKTGISFVRANLGCSFFVVRFPCFGDIPSPKNLLGL